MRHLILLAALVGTSASADTLREALAKAYATNPTITGARAGQRATDENVVIQRARGLPSIAVSAGYNEFVSQPASFTQTSRQVSANAQLSVPIYQGGGIRNATRAADARVQAGAAGLIDTEATIFSQVVGAYMDVIRDSALVDLNRGQVRVLTTNLQATRDRFQIGDLTRTDVAQSEARLAGAQGQLDQAEAQLISTKESYVRLVGTPPDALEPPPPLPAFPADPQSAVTTAIDNNPGLAAAIRRRDAARFDIGTARATRLPRLSATGTESYSNNLNSLRSSIPGLALPQIARSTTVGLQATIPLFQGGGPAAQIRQAQAFEAQAIENVTLTERSIVAQTRAAFASFQASNDLIVSSEAQVAATTLSLEGVRAENSVGNRTILDILNAEQELLNAQTNLLAARRNAYVAGFTLLAAMGRATARDLGLEGGALYDPQVNYRRVKGKFFDWGNDPAPQPVATRTVDTPPQTAASRLPGAQ